MTIQKAFILRYRAEGHIRFQVPNEVCQANMAKALTNGVLAIDGVYRVQLYRSQQKLSIHYQESVCDFQSLARQLYSLLTELEKNDALEQKETPKARFNAWREKAKQKFQNLKSTRWAKEKYTDAKETVQAAKVIGKLSMKKPQAFMADPEKAAIDFFTDMLVIFLIKLHWEDITQKWLLKPFKHRYEWMALFYMFFLLVRSRRKK
ncbi:hypothetical protein BAC3_01463 [uncultured bacterium]|nr:hypothetical protein BAC3_01463 [uncultured bacterium]